MKLTKIIVACMLVLAITSCSKDKESIREGIMLTIDGKDFSFDFFSRAELEKVGDVSSLVITGADKETHPNLISLSIASSDSLTEGNYVHDLDNNDLYVSMDWSAGDEDYGNPFLGGFESEYPMSITITSLSATNVQGTFQGTVSRGNETKTISNGSFNLTLQ